MLKKALDTIEDYFLRDKLFIAGDKNIYCRREFSFSSYFIATVSPTDLQFVCQITQYWLIGKDVYKGRPNTERWVGTCREIFAPHFDIVYREVYDLAKSGTLTGDLDL